MKEQLLAFAQRISPHQHLITPSLIMIMLVMFMIPVPTIVLDIMIAANFTIGLTILITVMYMPKPTSFSVFPSILLITTLFRLSLNVASTRVILLRGHEGEAAAGTVIRAFGQFVVGGEYLIGILIFAVLITIQMMVINTGSSRIAEVTARFTLDAMPGKQMSIDADLNSGIITEEEARQKRKDLQEEADFYGSMDGAIKFVAKDAMAGLIITAINIVGGLTFGVVRHEMDLAEAATTFTILTIGDGLVSALPSLFISIAAGLLTTRATAKKTLGEDVLDQVFYDKKPLAFVGGSLFLFGMVPGLPTLAFWSLSAALLGFAYYKHTSPEGVVVPAALGPGGAPGGDKKPEAIPGGKGGPPATPQPEPVEKLLKVDMMGLEVGYGLISLVDTKRGGNILERIKSIRRQLALELGVVVPPIRIRDNLQLRPNQYSVLVKGVSVATGELMLNHLLAMNPGTATAEIDGVLTREPAFGLDAYWIREELKEEAQNVGYTVVDLQTVVTTHLSEIIKRHAPELLGRQETQALLDNLADTYPKIVEDLVPTILPLGTVQRVLQNLLAERVSVRDLLSVLEALADGGMVTKDPYALTELVRQAISRGIVAPYLNDRGEIAVIALNPELERKLTEAIQQTESGNFVVIAPEKAQQFVDNLQQSIQNSAFAIQPIVLVNPGLRMPLRRLLERVLPNLLIFSQSEVPAHVNIITIGVVGDI
ncbi:flagellar biosynthesis protein FlhA [Acanthopleuribacter pedis]|uniref:Flagellar biosynthesis protein FlhA n=1 Tax=Acanthopleuribacter pedis TaxID=442870 RepID=A0A8J7QKV5_9BACT|nr:flagellar biosynthesis protein FlhA [Acanthopleuribacter pedis]MBO1322931.1 flagellar biosynthesis protein FlhA [Acanthopleuribacter pedis]